MGYALKENDNGLLRDFAVCRATGTAERGAVPVLLDDAPAAGLPSQDPAGVAPPMPPWRLGNCNPGFPTWPVFSAN